MKTALVTFNNQLNFNNENSLTIDTYKWATNDYKPLVEVFLCHNNNRLKVKFIAHEKETFIKSFEDDGKIWCDSCVEFFVKPYDDDDRYINFEINPVGAMIMQIGEDRNDRNSLVKEYKSQLNVKTETQSSFWTVTLEIPFSILSKIFNRKALKSSDTIYGNFYKCGDETPNPHFGMWGNIGQEKPDFHVPKYFNRILFE